MASHVVTIDTGTVFKMGLFKILVVLLVGMSYCVLAQAQQSQIRNNDSDKSSNKSGRMIATGGSRNSVDRKSTGASDNVFDNDPKDLIRDNSEIFFPSELPPRTEIVEIPSRRVIPVSSRVHAIPLSALDKFGSETDLAEFFTKYVNNTQVITDADTSETILANLNGTALLNARNKPFVLTTGVGNLRPWQPPIKPGFGIKPRAGNKPVAITTTPPASNGPVIPTEFTDSLLSRGMTTTVRQSTSLSGCSPEKTAVSVPLKVEPNMLIIPKCIKIERCGGCCLSDLTVCEPEEIEKTEHFVSKLRYVGDSNGENPGLVFDELASVEIEKHKKCKCKCRTKKEHCKSHHHEYVENQCSCVCTNYEDHRNCVEGSANRIWDNASCQCSCKDVKVCSSGLRFDLNTCNCEKELDLLDRRLGPQREPKKQRASARASS